MTLIKADFKTISDRPSVKLQKTPHLHFKNTLIAISDWRYIDSQEKSLQRDFSTQPKLNPNLLIYIFNIILIYWGEKWGENDFSLHLQSADFQLVKSIFLGVKSEVNNFWLFISTKPDVRKPACTAWFNPQHI